MPPRSSRSDRFVDRIRLLISMGACGEESTCEMARMQINGPLYYSASTVLAAHESAFAKTKNACFGHDSARLYTSDARTGYEEVYHNWRA